MAFWLYPAMYVFPQKRCLPNLTVPPFNLQRNTAADTRNNTVRV